MLEWKCFGNMSEACAFKSVQSYLSAPVKSIGAGNDKLSTGLFLMNVKPNQCAAASGRHAGNVAPSSREALFSRPKRPRMPAILTRSANVVAPIFLMALPRCILTVITLKFSA